MIIGDWLHVAQKQLTQADTPSARLDCEIILAQTLNRSRTYLHAHPEEMLDPQREQIANARLQLRTERVPMAYIIGHKEFYRRRFYVSPATLIPRPESEALLILLERWLKKHPTSHARQRCVDIGTGSGCLGISAQLEHPQLDVTLIDVSKKALAVAQKNATYLSADVTLLKSSLLQQYPYAPDIVIANLPYVDTSWECSPETTHEPQQALYAESDGYALIFKLIDQLQTRLTPHGVAFFEADARQFETIKHYAEQREFAITDREGICFSLENADC